MTIEAELHSMLLAAQARRDAGQWEQAARLFRRAEMLAPGAADIKHNLALVCFAKGDPLGARAAAERAVRLKPELWQSHALLARLYQGAGDPGGAEIAWRTVLKHSPGNGTALLGLADLTMNEFADPVATIALVEPLAHNPAFAADAELTTLMALLYHGGISAEALSARLIAFSRANLRLPQLPQRRPRAGRRRIGIMSPFLSASPAYYLAYSGLQALAQAHDLIFFTRGTRFDWATERLRALGQWIEAAHVEPGQLAQRIADADIDVLIDMGGWSDVPGLKALSARPAPRIYKWVGGQSATTGLDMIDGWIGDGWQCPPGVEALYAEPIVNIAGGYVDYSPPDMLAAHAGLPKRGVALVGNPAKIGEATFANWPSGVDRVILIDRRYAHPRVRDRITELLARHAIAVDRIVTPPNHEAYLRAIGGCEAIVNTQPYAAGLTAVEALALGVKLLSGGVPGGLFCARHHLSHLQTGGRNSTLGAQLRDLVAR
ncbi:tetratricopeptide repeat protein [Sphingomonas sp. MMS24-J13]|uniref:tetratricopeptide repeat protein n=1 Tax=Sphingomonas sp. MMS24-J13 TaxID=3238686 RepID=UPI00384CA37D